MTSTLILLARYNKVMNQRNYQAALQLDDIALNLPRGAFFGSIMGTLNHIMLADILWLQRFANHPTQFTSLRAVLKFPQPITLAACPIPDVHQWFAQRSELDHIISALTLEITEADLDSVLYYTQTNGEQSAKPLGALLLHFFNHQTHHRGQVSTLLYQAGIDVGVTDLSNLIPNVTDGA